MANQYKCDMCGVPATVHITKIIDGKKIVVHLCQHCAEKNSMSIAPEFPQDILPKIKEIEDEFFAKTGTEDAHAASCPVCGTPLSSIEKTSRFHCPNCYKAFPEKAKELVMQMQGGSLKHTGKVPPQMEAKVDLSKKMNDIKTELDRAVQQERYEDAAVLRDKLKVISK